MNSSPDLDGKTHKKWNRFPLWKSLCMFGSPRLCFLFLFLSFLQSPTYDLLLAKQSCFFCHISDRIFNFPNLIKETLSEKVLCLIALASLIFTADHTTATEPACFSLLLPTVLVSCEMSDSPLLFQSKVS